ncbi:pyrokinin-1 receptor-like isoform X2 [Bradysia coprophila]|uniref:pyrokinin-1 receptor-like isoform X2 n=1 Tax=Bradysia coprophila TaxID=38358 RepID=UPI00187D8413|nr:pyrokinin-1 receptor-like isoform X2 [Bradysia coprophila]
MAMKRNLIHKQFQINKSCDKISVYGYGYCIELISRHRNIQEIKMNYTFDSEILLQIQQIENLNLTFGMLLNLTQSNSTSVDNLTEYKGNERDSMAVVIPVTVCYAIIFVAGVLGNVITCTVISRNKSMHTATNYYLFNLAISDLMLLLSGLLSETSTNATVLTITSFTIERYIAICHPFRQHTMSKLSRAIKFIMAIWIVAFCLAIPQAIQFGVVTTAYGGQSCTVKNVLVEHAFEVSSFLFFVGPMTLICVLYVLIGIKLRKSKLLQGVKRRSCEFGRGITGQTRVIRMLIAVAVAFFLCWAPFHAQRIMAVYGKATQTTNDRFHNIYTILTYVSGVLYFLSTCINPLLYSIMSHKFRDAFKTTLARHFHIGPEYNQRTHIYSALSKYNGNGSIRLTTSNANRMQQSMEPHIQKIESNLSILQSEPTSENKTAKNAIPPQRQRCVSVSQSTLVTSLSKSDVLQSCTTNFGDKMPANNNKRISSNNNHNNNNHHQSTLSTIAEKLRRGTRKVLLFRTSPNNSTPQSPVTKEAKLKKGNSVDSAHTNTISNSSLQEVDAEEFDSAELTKFMGEINNEIR